MELLQFRRVRFLGQAELIERRSQQQRYAKLHLASYNGDIAINVESGSWTKLHGGAENSRVL